MAEEKEVSNTASEAPASAGTATEARPDTSVEKAPDAGGQAPETAGEASYAGSYKTREEADKGIAEKDDTISKLKSERDKAYGSLNQLSPYFDYDEAGRPTGLKKTEAEKPTATDAQLAEALLDPDRAGEAIGIITERVSKKVGGDMSLRQRTQWAEAKSYELFPELKDPNSEIFAEAQKEYLMYSAEARKNNPELVLTVAKAASANLLNRDLPNIRRTAEDGGRQAAYRTRLEKGGSAAEAGTGVARGEEIPISDAERRAMVGMGISEEKWKARKKLQMERVAEGGKRV